MSINNFSGITSPLVDGDLLKPFHASLMSKHEIAPNTTELTFNIDPNFHFIAGQYVTITNPLLHKLPIKEQYRDFSIVSSPDEEGKLTIAFRNSNSEFKRSLIQGKKDLEVTIEGPKGILTLKPKVSGRTVFIAGGIGITPFISIIRHIHHLSLSKSSLKPTLFFYNTSLENAPYLEELKKYKNNIELNIIEGKIQSAELENYHKTHKDALWYCAGPREMVTRAREILTSLQVEEQNIKSEEFSGYEN